MHGLRARRQPQDRIWVIAVTVVIVVQSKVAVDRGYGYQRSRPCASARARRKSKQAADVGIQVVLSAMPGIHNIPPPLFANTRYFCAGLRVRQRT
jgi:hypothetical protein